MTPRVIVLDHFQHGPLRVVLFSEDAEAGRYFFCPEHPQRGFMHEGLFKQSRAQISEMLGAFEREPMEGIAPHDDRREESFVSAFMRLGRL